MNKWQKLLKEKLEARKALLAKMDALQTAVEKNADKKETTEQRTAREGHEGELAVLDAEIAVTEKRADAQAEQERLEKRLGGRRRTRRFAVHGGGEDDDEDDNEERDDAPEFSEADTERLEELEARTGRLSREERTELKELRAAKEASEEAPEPRSQRRLGGGQDGLSARDLRDLQKYSFLRAINARLDGKELDGLEGEMHAEAIKEFRNAKTERQGGNLLIPQLILRHASAVGSFEDLHRRDLTATGTTSVSGDQGGMTIQTSVGSLIDRLRNALVMRQMGVTVIGGLQGNIDFPKVIADDEAVEKAENATSAESSVTFSKVSLSPRRLPVYAELSRQLLLQTTADVEAWVRNDLAFQIAQVMDSRMISGTGSGQPTGILNTAGVGAVALGTNGAAPTWDMLVDLETTIAALNADVGQLGYLTNAKVRGKLKKTLVTSGGTANTAAEMIWDKRSPASPLNEYKTSITNLVPSNLTKAAGSSLSAMIFGNFNDLLVGQWGGLEFLINPYSRDTEGLIRLNCWTFFDLVVRRVESFAVCKDIVTT